MNKIKKHIALILSVVMFLSIVSIDINIAEDLEAMETLETSVSKLLQGIKNDEDGRRIVETAFIGNKYTLINGMVISYSILRDYKKAVYVPPNEDVSGYSGHGDLKGKEHRFIGYTFDRKAVTNPKFMDDASSSVDLRDKDWQLFNKNLYTYADSRAEQEKYLFQATLYDPIGSNKRPISMNVKDILRKTIPSGEDAVIKTYSQMGSAPTLNNEGTVMLQHLTSRGGKYYDTFVVDPLDIGATYNSVIVQNDNDETKVNVKYGRYVFPEGKDYIKTRVEVRTTIDISQAQPKADVIFAFDEQLIEFKGDEVVPSFDTDEKTLVKSFEITFKRDELKLGDNIIDLSALTHLKSIYGDQKKVKGFGQIIISIPMDSDVDFQIKNGDDDVTDSIVEVGENIEKISDDESIKDIIKRLDLIVDLKLKGSINVQEPNITWYALNKVLGANKMLNMGSEEIDFQINKNNVDIYLDDDGKIKFNLIVVDKYARGFDKVHHTSIELNYKTIVIPKPPVNQAPIAVARATKQTKAGSIISFNGTRSSDPDGYITDYDFNDSGIMRIMKINSSGKSGYATPIYKGNASISVTVTDNSGLTDTDSAEIEVLSPIGHNEVIRGSKKINRKITLDARADSGTYFYPSDEFETSWEVTPLEGQPLSSIKWDTNNQGKLVDLLFKVPGIYEVKKIVKAKCTYSGGVGMFITEETVRGIRIYPDGDPVANFAVVKYNLRKRLDDGYATIKVYDTSYSPDRDKIYKRAWWYKYDANNNGEFDDEVLQLFDSENDLTEISLRVKDVGRYEFKLSIEEDFTEDTIARFISSEDIRTDTSDDIDADEKFAEVLNVAPIVKLEEKANKKVEMIVITDYLASDRANLESELSLLTKAMQEKKLNLIPYMMNVNDDGNSVSVGKKEVPVYRYTRHASVSVVFPLKVYNIWWGADAGTTNTRPAVLTGTKKLLDSEDRTIKEAKLLPKFPLAYMDRIYVPYLSEGWYNHDDYGRFLIVSGDIYDEPNLSRGSYYVPKLYVSSYRGYNYDWHVEGDSTGYYGSVDKEFVRGNQVSTKLEDMDSINTDKIEALNLDDNSDKYLLILTNSEDTTKSLDTEFLDYLKAEGFKIRYSVAELAKTQIATGDKYTDVRFTEDSIILKTDTGKYYELGNSTVANQVTFPVETSETSKLNLFKSLDSHESVGGDIKVPVISTYTFDRTVMYDYNRTVENYKKYLRGDNYKYTTTNIIFKDGALTGKGIKLSGIEKIYVTDIGLVCDMKVGNVKIITHDTTTLANYKIPSNLSDYGINRYIYYFGGQVLGSMGLSSTMIIVDTNLDKVVSLKSSQSVKTGISSTGDSVVTEPDKKDAPYHILLHKAVSTIRGKNGRAISIELAPQYGNAFIKDMNFHIGSYKYRAEKRVITLELVSVMTKKSVSTASLSSNKLNLLELDTIDFDKAYTKNDMLIYIKDGIVYGKGNSDAGELGLVSWIDEFKAVSDITLDEAYKGKTFVSANQLLINPESASYADQASTFLSIVNDYADYSTDETIYKLLGETLEFDTFYFDYENDPLQDTRYDYTHEEIFDNSMGVDPINNTSSKELAKMYTKVGKYIIKPRYQDNPKNIGVFNNYWLWNQDNTKINLIVHRKPVALARYTSKNLPSNTYEITLKDDDSYDIDHTSLSNKGIIQWSWFIRDMDTLDTTIYNTKTVTFTKSQSKRLKVGLKVKDLEGQWSEYAYIDIDNIPKPKIKLDFEIRPVNESFSISDIPATEYLDIYDIKTSHANPIILETYIEDSDGVRVLIESFDSQVLMSDEDGVMGFLKEDNETIEWTSSIYHILKKYKDGSYNVVLKAIDKTCLTNFTENKKPFIINTPINLSAVVPDEIVQGSEYVIESYASKYTDKVKLKVYDKSDKLILDSYMTHESTSLRNTNSEDAVISAKKKFTKNLSSSDFELEGEVRFEFTGTIESEPEKSEELIKNSKYIDLAFANVRLYGGWSKWDGGSDLLGNTLTNNPRRFLSFERIFVEATTIGNPDKLLLDLSDELKAMSFTDDKGNVYRYVDFVKYEVEFPLEFTKISDNYWEVEYILPLANSTLSFEDDRLREAYSLSVKVEKSSSEIRYIIDKDSLGGGIEITGNVYDHFYIQKK